MVKNLLWAIAFGTIILALFVFAFGPMFAHADTTVTIVVTQSQSSTVSRPVTQGCDWTYPSSCQQPVYRPYRDYKPYRKRRN